MQYLCSEVQRFSELVGEATHEGSRHSHAPAETPTQIETVDASSISSVSYALFLPLAKMNYYYCCSPWKYRWMDGWIGVLTKENIPSTTLRSLL